MKPTATTLISLFALTMSAAAWATPPGNGAIKAPLDGMSGPPARPLEGIVRPPTPEATTPKGVSPAVWRQYEYDHATLKINGPNNGKPETKLQVQQAELDKISGARAVVGKGATIKGVGGIEDNGTNTPVILKVSSQTVTLPGGAEVKAFRLADGNLYYKAPGTGMPTKLGFAAPESKELLAKDGNAAAAVKLTVDPETALAATRIVDKVVPDYYMGTKFNFGDIKVVGKPKFEATANPDVVIATGTFNDNELWGGAFDYHYKVEVNLKTHRITPLAKPVEGRETN